MVKPGVARSGAFKLHKGLLYILTSVWVLHTPYASLNMLYQGFSSKKA